jgi:hypothetical protein
MADTKKTLREELEAEFACLNEFGVTAEELEALYEMCGLKPRRSFMLSIKRVLTRFKEKRP